MNTLEALGAEMASQHYEDLQLVANDCRTVRTCCEGRGGIVRGVRRPESTVSEEFRGPGRPEHGRRVSRV